MVFKLGNNLYLQRKQNGMQGKEPWNKGKSMEAYPHAGFQKGHQVFAGSEKTQFQKGQGINEENVNWRGDLVGSTAIHTWVKRRLGTASKCEVCLTPSAKLYVWANLSHEYKRELNDWKQMCHSCHMHFDRLNGWGDGRKEFEKREAMKCQL